MNNGISLDTRMSISSMMTRILAPAIQFLLFTVTGRIKKEVDRLLIWVTCWNARWAA